MVTTRKRSLFVAVVSAICLAVIVFGLGSFLFNSKATSGQPNIILIISDDQRADTLQYMPLLMEKLAKFGATFSHAYVPTPLCCPSRSSILSGEYAHNHGVIKNDPPYGFQAFNDTDTIATRLHDAGYHTALYGKYLNGYLPTANDMYEPPGWDTFHAFIGEPAYNNYSLAEFTEGDGGEIVHYGNKPMEYSTDVIFNRAANAIRNQEKSDNDPFFLYVAPYGPHRPTIPAERHWSTNVTIPNPPSFNEPDVSDKPSFIATAPLLTDKQINDIGILQNKTVRTLQSIDEGVSTLIEALRDKGELDNTVIIYIGDNGFHWGEHRLEFGKITAYDESLRVPLVIFDGRKPEAETRDELVMNIDLAPTIFSFAGIAAPQTDGQSLTPLVADQNPSWRDDFVIESWALDRGQFSGVHTRDWVYVEHDNGEKEMYDLKNDPYELTNLVRDPAYEAKRTTLAGRLQEIKACKGTTCP